MPEEKGGKRIIVEISHRNILFSTSYLNMEG